MEGVPLETKIGFTRDVVSAGRSIESGVVAATSRTRQKYWNQWCRYAGALQVDPLLQHTHPFVRDVTVTAFAARVRTGHYGLGNQVTVQSVNNAIAAINKTIELAGLPSPLYRSHNKYNLQIERCLEGMRREDPPAIPQLALPITVPNYLHDEAYSEQCDCPWQQAIADLSQIAFYFLLRVGEYTKPRYTKHNGRTVRATRTVQFRVQDIGFFKSGKVLPRRSPLLDLSEADQVTMKITNQKNGRMGETISHERIRTDLALETGPIKALARRIHHILSNGGLESAVLCEYIDDDGIWQSVTSTNMRSAIRRAAQDLNLHENGIDPDLIGSHSLRAGGAMALKLQGVSDTIIQKQGRWRSVTFLQYIHTQIAHLTKDLSTKMSTVLKFQNIAAIEASE